jgi:hypothetical protein
MTFERDLFISFSGGVFAGIVILIVPFVFGLNIPLFEKIIIIPLSIILIFILYVFVSILLKRIYNKHINFRI